MALALRLYGLRYGLPAVYNPDEVSIVSRAPGWSLHSFFPLPGFIAALACHHG